MQLSARAPLGTFRAAAEEFGEHELPPLAFVQVLERQRRRDVAGTLVAERAQVRRGPARVLGDVARGERGLLEQLRTVARSLDDLECAVDHPEEVVPARLRGERQLDPVERPSRARHDMEYVLEGLGEERGIDRALPFERGETSTDRVRQRCVAHASAQGVAIPEGYRVELLELASDAHEASEEGELGVRVERVGQDDGRTRLQEWRDVSPELRSLVSCSRVGQ